MSSRRNLYENFMSNDYAKLQKLLDEGNVVACYVNFLFDTGEKKIIYRDIAKARNNGKRLFSGDYGYIVECRGKLYISWDKNMERLRKITFDEECEKLRLEFIDVELMTPCDSGGIM